MEYIKKLIVILIVLAGLVMAGCSKSKEEIAKEALRNKYNEEFNIYGIDSNSTGGVGFNAVASPVNNPNVVFKISLNSDGSLSHDEYVSAYVMNLMKETIENDMNTLFPKSYFRFRGIVFGQHAISDFRNKSIEEIIGPNKEEGQKCFIDIYLEKDEKSSGDYKKEYEYFIGLLDSYENDNNILPVAINFIYVNDGHLEFVKEYFQKNVERSHYFKEQTGVTDRAITSSYYFYDKKSIISCEEYVERRTEDEK